MSKDGLVRGGIQCSLKISSHIYVLLCCSLMLKSFSPLINVHSMYKLKYITLTLVFRYCPQYWADAPLAVITALSLLCIMQRVLHTWIWGFSTFLRCRSSQDLSGWMGTVGGGVSPEMFDWAGPTKDIHRIVPNPLLHCLGCVLRLIVPLEGWTYGPVRSRVLFIKISPKIPAFHLDISALWSIQLSLNPDQCPSPCLWKTPPQHDAATTTCFIVGIVLGW